MEQKMLITKFNYNISREEYENNVNQLGQAFADVPGCTWKIWLIDDEKKEAGALYLFEDETALQKFKASPLVAAVLSHPALSNFEMRETEILKDLSAVTRGPL